MKTSEGRIIFEGNYKNDKRDGFGILKRGGETYEGQWKFDQYEG